MFWRQRGPRKQIAAARGATVAARGERSLGSLPQPDVFFPFCVSRTSEESQDNIRCNGCSFLDSIT
jgi:hypothetical protein